MTKETLKTALPPSVVRAIRSVKSSPAKAVQAVAGACGYNISRRKDYYSPLPSVDDLRRTKDRWQKPSSLTGIRYDLEEMKRIARDLFSSSELAKLPSFQEITKAGFGPGYPRVDAMVLYAMIRRYSPARYVEIGSGVSTYYCSLAAKENAREGHPLRITCVEPHPFPALRNIPDIDCRVCEVQDVDRSIFEQLGPGDVLFIDSSHIIRIDGDVPFLYLEVLPALKPGVLIHIHDMPLPFLHPYPADFWVFNYRWPMFWNEPMMVQALMCGNRNFEILLSLPMLRHYDEPFLRSLVPGYRGISEEPNTFSSLWLLTR